MLRVAVGLTDSPVYFAVIVAVTTKVIIGLLASLLFVLDTVIVPPVVELKLPFKKLGTALIP
jgi:hypothetical protein